MMMMVMMVMMMMICLCFFAAVGFAGFALVFCFSSGAALGVEGVWPLLTHVILAAALESFWLKRFGSSFLALWLKMASCVEPATRTLSPPHLQRAARPFVRNCQRPRYTKTAILAHAQQFLQAITEHACCFCKPQVAALPH